VYIFYSKDTDVFKKAKELFKKAKERFKKVKERFKKAFVKIGLSVFTVFNRSAHRF